MHAETEQAMSRVPTAMQSLLLWGSVLLCHFLWHFLLSRSCSGRCNTAYKHFPHFQQVYTFTSHKSENISGFLLFLFKSLENNINPSFLFWRSQQHSLSLLVPSAAIKRCGVSECDQLLCRGSAVVLETIQHSRTSQGASQGC